MKEAFAFYTKVVQNKKSSIKLLTSYDISMLFDSRFELNKDKKQPFSHLEIDNGFFKLIPELVKIVSNTNLFSD